MKAGLKIKLILSYLTISLILVVFLLFFARTTVNREFENYVKGNLERNSSEIAEQAGIIYKSYHTGQAYELYRRLGEYAVSKGLVLSIEDEQGNLVWCMDCEDPDHCQMMLSGMEHNMNRIYQGFSGEYAESVYPIDVGDNRVGTVVLGYYGPFYYDNLDVQFLTLLNRGFIIAAAGALAVSVLLGLFMAGRISGPVKKVIRKTKEIEGGNYDALIEETSNTVEMEQLIGSVNTLAATLDRQKELRRRLAQDYAHEFRTPLAALQSNLEAMVDGIWEPTGERLLGLEEEVQRLTRMVGELDYLVEVEANVAIERTSFDVLEMIQVNLANFESEIHRKQLQADVHGQTFQMYADRDKMGQVIINLLSNAIKYTASGGKIDIRISQSSKNNIIEVCDNGIGISPEDLPDIFEHLYRADRSRAADTGGSGIGLAVVKAIVEAHEGTVTAKSEEGRGSRFIITIPK